MIEGWGMRVRGNEGGGEAISGVVSRDTGGNQDWEKRQLAPCPSLTRAAGATVGDRGPGDGGEGRGEGDAGASDLVQVPASCCIVTINYICRAFGSDILKVPASHRVEPSPCLD